MRKNLKRIVLACLLASIAGLSSAQDFEQVTENVEINFPESDGVFTCRPACGIPIPEPKVMNPELGWVELGRLGQVSCAIVTAPDASTTEKAAARELSAQIAFLCGMDEGPPIVTAGNPVSAPAVCVIGVKPELFGDIAIEVPGRHEGFAIKTGKWHGKDAVFVAGRDRFGVYWGVQTLKQMVHRQEYPKKHASVSAEEADLKRVVAPQGYFADWPDVQYRMSPYKGETGLRMGRCNTSYTHIYSRDKKSLKSRDELKKEIDAIHKTGFICVPMLSWLRLDIALRNDKGRTKYPLPNREICPVTDVPIIESIVTNIFEDGGDGVCVFFDDIEPLANHHKKCPVCQKRFKHMTEWQAFVLERIYSLAKRDGWGQKLFIACPTDYYRLDLRSDKGLKRYFSTLCGFPGSENFKFYHTGFTRKDLKRLADAGLKNYIWFNNGAWPAKNIGLKYDVGYSRMKYSWGLFGRDEKGMEKFFPERLAELRFLGENVADLVFTGAGGPFGPSLGSMFAWDSKRFLFREEEYRKWFMDNMSGEGVFEGRQVWEWATKPLAAKCLTDGTFDPNDERRLALAKMAADLVNAIPNPRTGKGGRRISIDCLGNMKKALMVRTEFVEKYRDLPGKVAKKAVFRRPKDCLISISPETLLEEKSTAPVTIESWDSPDGLKLVDCVFKPAAKSAPASLGVKAGKNEGFGERKFDLNANGGNLLVIPCGIARGTKLTAEILVDGATYSNSVASHGPNWQELLLPFEGEKIKSLSLRLERAPEIERPAKNSEARLRSILLQKVNRETDALSLSGGKSLKFAEFDGRKNFLLAENKLSAVDQRFVLNERSFSVEAVFTPIKTSNFKIIGTRAAVSPSYTGLPGWALGAAFGKIYFTLEDRDDIVSSARSDHKLFKAYSTCRVLAVRDFENRKLRLYVNGRKFEVDEKGCGNLGDQAKLTVSFDTWSGKSMNGVLEYVKIYERAIPDKEAKEMFEK